MVSLFRSRGHERNHSALQRRIEILEGDSVKELAKIQQELKAPKGQYNSFGKYKYRSCEDILEAVKPLLDGCVLTLNDEIVEVGSRVYVKATASLQNEKGTSFSTSSFAREPASKKGMDESQITGAASSYARKYALNGLFAIDDTVDSDGDDGEQFASPEEQKQIKDLLGNSNKALKEFLESAKIDSLEKLSADRVAGAIAYLSSRVLS